jgi:hypothetical protein
MKKNKIIVIFSTHLSDEENRRFVSHVNSTIGVAHSVFYYINHNEFSLSEIYNRAIAEHNEENSIMVFCHNDIIFKTKDWGKKLLHKFNNFDYQILGVAGSTFLPNTGRWWDDRSKMVGTVEHTNGLREWASEYSSPFVGVKDVCLVDGLFMAVDTNDIIHNFDEEFKGFHFYDLGFCFPNYLEGCNIGVVNDIRILHKSVGQTNQQWEENRLQFVEKYKEELPMKHINEKLNVLICCQFFNHYTGSEICVYEFAKELKKQGCNVTIISGMVGEPMLSKAKNLGINVHIINNAPNFVLQQQGLTFYRNEVDFDIIHINHKPIGEMILQLYPNTPAVMHVHSEVIPHFEEPIINPQIKKYLSIRDTVTDYITTFGVDRDNIEIVHNPFDITRFNTNYVAKSQEKESILFIGTLDHLRKNILFDLKEMTKNEGKELWIIGADSLGYLKELTNDNHVKYLGIKDKPEEYLKKCTYTAGIFKGRSTIEGWLCGKAGYIYDVDKQGNIVSKEFKEVPDDIEKYYSNVTTGKLLEIYKEVLGND